MTVCQRIVVRNKTVKLWTTQNSYHQNQLDHSSHQVHSLRYV